MIKMKGGRELAKEMIEKYRLLYKSRKGCELVSFFLDLG